MARPRGLRRTAFFSGKSDKVLDLDTLHTPSAAHTSAAHTVNCTHVNTRQLHTRQLHTRQLHTPRSLRQLWEFSGSSLPRVRILFDWSESCTDSNRFIADYGIPYLSSPATVRSQSQVVLSRLLLLGEIEQMSSNDQKNRQDLCSEQT